MKQLLLMCLPLSFKKYFLFLFSLVIFCFSQEIFSQDVGGITVSPFFIEEVVKPNQCFTKEITVTNKSQEKVIFFISLQDIKLDEKGRISLLPLGSEKFSFINWVEVLENKMELGPEESKKIEIQFRIPEAGVVGSRHGAIIFSSKPLSLEQRDFKEGVFAIFSHQVGVLVFLYSERDVKEEAKILKFQTDKKYYFTPFKIKFQIEIENIGNVYLEPAGKIEITNFFNKEIKSLIFNQQRLKILPETKRKFEEDWQSVFGFGKHTATLYLTFGTPKNQGGSGIKTIFAKSEFWIFPLKEIILIFIVLLFFGFFAYLLVKKYKRISQKIKNGN